VSQLSFDVLDIGARYGVHHSLRRLVGIVPVHLFEPDPTESRRLLNQYESEPKVHVHEVALGNPSTSRRFLLRRHRGLSGFADIAVDEANWKLPIRGVEEETQINVEVRPLSDFIVEDPVMIKIDTEGSELEILGSAGERLKSVMAIRLEFNMRSMWTTGTSFAKIDSFLEAHGFSFIGFDSPPNGSVFGKFPLPQSRGQLIAGDGLWIRRSSESPHSEAEILCKSFFFYLNGVEGLGLEEICKLSFDSRQKVCVSLQSPLEALMYALILKHLLAAGRLSHFGYSTVDDEHRRLFGRAIPEREMLFQLLNQVGLDFD
jgi:FkbM family methyltransferase